jgi:hypothetical protein
MENEKELRQLFKNRSDCYTQLTEGGLKELVVEQALTEDGFINILNELERKKKDSTSEQLEHDGMLGVEKINEEWIQIDPNKILTIPRADCWVFNMRTKKVEFSQREVWLPLNTYSHYKIVKKPEPPK